MKTRVTLRSLLALLLLAAMAFSFCPPAWAGILYPDDQYYVCDEDETHVFAVQVVATNKYASAVSMRTKMLNAGYDAFIYEYEGKYRVMCGKFRDKQEALVYQQSIHVHTDREGAYVTNAYLPEYAVWNFEDIYYDNPVELDTYDTYWEVPTGAYFRADAANTIQAYTVQFSSGTSFNASQRNRDLMDAQGFPSFVYKVNLEYRIMSGLFYTKEEAQAHRTDLTTHSDRKYAYVKTVNVPASAVEYYQKNGSIPMVSPVAPPSTGSKTASGVKVVGTWDDTLTGWQEINGTWYYFDEHGVMQTGWICPDGKWYFLDNSGAKLTKVIFDDGNGIYAVDEDGVMVTNRAIVDSTGYTYQFGADGKCINH